MKFGIIAVGLTTLVLTTVSYADLTIQKRVPIGKGVVVSHAVRTQCKLQTKVPHFIQLYSRKGGLNVNLTNKKISRIRGRKLVITIVHTSSGGGGAWSGSKSVTIAGVLKKGNRTIARFTAGRRTGGGFFGGYKGTCSLLGRCAKTIGRDVALWLKNPRDGAYLGNITRDQRRR